MTRWRRSEAHAAGTFQSENPARRWRIEAFPTSIVEWIGLTTGVGAVAVLRYALFAGIAWLLAYVWFRRRWFHRKIIQRLPESADVRREMAHSLRSAAIFGLVGAATILAAREGWTRLYWDIHERPHWWFLASIVLTIFLHDAWFYWTHRLMHHPKLFRFVHHDHHRSRNPTSWAAFAFCPTEAAIQAAIFPLVVTIVPMHPLAFVVFMTWQTFFNVIGHTGYEYNPPKFARSWLRFVINTPTNHVMHHETMKGNFGLYFNFWDRLMGTNHPDYDDRFHDVASRARPMEDGGREATGEVARVIGVAGVGMPRSDSESR